MKTRLRFLIISLAFLSSDSFAQEEKRPGSTSINQFIAVSWEINVPMGTGIVSKTSLSGGKVEYRKFLSEQFSAGIGLSWNSVEQYFNSKTYEKPDGSIAVTTDMVRQTFNMPITATAHYYPSLSSHIFKPFIGVGLGAQYSAQDVFYNIYVIEHSDWGFVARPEIGTLAKFNDHIAGMASVGWNYSTNKIDALGISGLKQVCFNFGLAFLMD